MVSWYRTAGVFLLFLTFAAGPAWSVEVGQAAPDFRLMTLDGAPVSLADFKGKKPLMILFWATWCPLCKEEVPKVNRIAADFGPRGLAVLAINVGVNDSAGKAGAYRKKYRLDYPVAFDQGSAVTRAFGVAGTPTILITDKKGIVRYRSAAVPDDLKENFLRLME